MASSSSGSEDEWGQVKWRRYQHGCAVVQSSWSYSLRVECAKFLLLESAQPAQLNAFSHIFPIPFAHTLPRQLLHNYSRQTRMKKARRFRLSLIRLRYVVHWCALLVFAHVIISSIKYNSFLKYPFMFGVYQLSSLLIARLPRPGVGFSHR